MPKLFYSSHTITLALIAAIMLLLEVAQPSPRLLADDLAADRASTQVIKQVAKQRVTKQVSGSGPNQNLLQNRNL